MAIQTRRYFLQGPWPADLLAALDPTLAVVAQNWVVSVWITFDDAIATVAATDQRMARYGCVPDLVTTGAATAPFVGVRSPDGSIWTLSVDNMGVISTTKVT